MTGIPKSLEEAIDQSKVATQAAIQDGLTRLQIEMVIPELKQQPIAERFLTLFQELGMQFKVFFPDAGAAALAKRDWNNPDFGIRGINETKGTTLEPDDEVLLIVNPSAVEVHDVEKTCEAAAGRPVVLLNPQLEDVATIGIGYAGRQLRERFLNKLESIYYFRPFEGAAVFRCYPQSWQVWRETSPNEYELLEELPRRPDNETLERILFPPNATDSGTDATAPTPQRKKSFLGELQQFIRALTQ